MIEMTVAGIAIDATNHRTPIVLLKDGFGRRALPIWIGDHEARAILMALQQQRAPRPMTHDLIVNILEALDIKLERIVIHSLQDNTYYAVLTIRQGDVCKEIDARPSDAIALALRCDCPIWVMEAVVADASIPVDRDADEEERQAFRRFLDSIRPQDFIQQGRGTEDSSAS